jgi:threonylcarbamoyladenosine tRNA methylthiotransferase CDKAL1
VIYFETYGCPSNKADTEAMKALLGEKVCETEEEADIIIVNSCGVKGQTERKILKRVSQLCEKKKVIVSGCLPKITERIDSRASLLGINVSDILSVVSEVEKGNRVVNVADRRENKVLLQKRFSLITTIPISEGCLHACTYCATRFARGGLHSFPKKTIIQVMRDAYESGAREFHLTGQDVGCWGHDLNETLPDLLSAIENMEGDFLIRIGMMHPGSIMNILDNLTDAFMNERVFKFFHLPIESGSEKVLRDMGRRYTIQNVFDIVQAFRKKIERLYLCTDIIVGYPTETEEDFKDTLEVIARLAPDKVNATMFSPRPRTAASRMKDMPDRIKKERSRRLYRLRMDIASQINRRYVGKRFLCFIDECGMKRNMGRLPNYKPILVDGNMGEKKVIEISDFTPTYLISR